MWWLCWTIGSCAPALAEAPPDAICRRHTGFHVVVGSRDRYEQPWTNPWPGLTLASGTTSWTRVGTALRTGRLPSHGTSKPEELVRALQTDDPPPARGEDIALRAEVATVPWDEEAVVVRMAVTARRPRPLDRAPARIVAVVDTSSDTRHVDPRVARAALLELASALHSTDTLGIVTGDGVQLTPSPVDLDEVGRAIREVTATRTGGDVPHALRTALRLASDAPPDKVRRVMLISDGELSLVERTDALADEVGAYAARGVGLTAVGIGNLWGRDDSLEYLARAAGGTYLHVAGAADARSQLGDRLGGLLEPAAQDARVVVDWDPEHVDAVHRVGFHLDRLTYLGPVDQRVGMEIGAGRTVVVLFEVRPSDPTGSLGTVRLRHTTREGSETLARILPPASRALPFDTASHDLRLSVAAAGLGELLSGERSPGHVDPGQLREIAVSARRAEYAEDTELIELIDLATPLILNRNLCVRR